LCIPSCLGRRCFIAHVMSFLLFDAFFLRAPQAHPASCILACSSKGKASFALSSIWHSLRAAAGTITAAAGARLVHVGMSSNAGGFEVSSVSQYELLKGVSLCCCVFVTGCEQCKIRSNVDCITCVEFLCPTHHLAVLKRFRISILSDARATPPSQPSST